MPEASALRQLEEQNRTCQACPLRPAATQVVVSDGPVKARLVIIGEAPGAEEDRTGKPFVGPAGQLLDRILNAAGIERTRCYLTNMVKCRPPSHRDPDISEISTCTSLWLTPQLALLRPEVILTLGNTATQHLLQTQQGITVLRGQWFQYQHPLPDGTVHHSWLMPLLHPAYLLRADTPAAGGPKSLTWRDIQEVAAVLHGHKQPEITAQPGRNQPRLL